MNINQKLPVDSYPVATQVAAYLPEKESVQTGLLGLMVATSIISLVPTLRLAVSIALHNVTKESAV